MDKNVQMPDGRVVAFPDSMRDDEISAVLAKESKTSNAAPATSPKQAEVPGFMDKIAAVGAKIDESLKDSSGDGVIKSLGKKAGRGIMGAVNEGASTARSVIDLPSQTQINDDSSTPLPKDEYAVGKMTSLPGTNTSLGLPLYKMGKSIIGQGVDSVKAGYKAQQQGEGLPGIALSEFEQLPLAGDIVQDMEHGNAIGGVTKGLTRAAMFKGAQEVPKIIKEFPTAARAGKNFQIAKAGAGAIPIDMGAVGNQALEVQRLAESGGAMPKVIRDFVKRATDPNKGPITYNEARDFYSNATRLSADEQMRLTKVMKRQVGIFTNELGKSILDAAKRGGTADEYQKAMQQFRQVSKMRDAKDFAKDSIIKGVKYGVPTAIGGTAAAYAVKKAIQ